MKRSPIRVKPPRRGPMPPEIAEAVIRRSRGMCEIPYCGRNGHELHHRQLRSRGGPDTEANIIHLCGVHHDWAHANPAIANERGLILKSWEDPETRSVDWT